MTSALAQLWALLGLRWTMVRTRRARTAVLAAAVVLAVLLAVAAALPAVLPPSASRLVADLAPQAFLAFGVLAVVAPLSTLGGNEVMPPHQLVAYPVRPATQFLGGLALAPANLVWVLQLLALTTVTGVLARGGHPLPAAVTTAAYVVALAVLGQTLTWTVVGVRATRSGRRLVVVVALSLAVGVGLLLPLGAGPALARATSATVVSAVQEGAAGGGATWAAVTGTLVGLAGLLGRLGVRAAAWALRRPSDAFARATGSVRRAPARAGALAQLVATDRRSVWRAPALRRGCLITAVLPLALAVGAPLPWSSMVVLPGLVAAGAGLLFGVNLFCLDGPGAVWLASLPVEPELLVRAKLWVLTETVLAAVLLTAVAGALRSTGSPTTAQLTALLTSAVVCTVVVVAQCLSLSVRHPHAAQLAGPRSTVAPPGALVAASLRLALAVALVAVLLDLAAVTAHPAVAPLLAVLPLSLALWSLRRSLRVWRDSVARARIVQVVASA